ncbi:MAG TPA: FecR domain-containing protein, partial [Candidatus Tumulicola sp.]
FGMPVTAVASVPVEVTSVAGDVSIVRAQTGTPEVANQTATLSSGDSLITGDGAAVTVRIDGQTIRLAARTQLRVVDLDAGSVELQLAAGDVDLSVAATGAGATIDTPTATVRQIRAGTYSVSVSAGGQTVVSAGSGSVSIDGPAGQRVVQPGSSVGSE